MKKVRQIFVGIMLVVLCVGFTSCSDVSEDMDPILIESVDASDIDVKSEDPEDTGSGDPNGGGNGSGKGG